MTGSPTPDARRPRQLTAATKEFSLILLLHIYIYAIVSCRCWACSSTVPCYSDCQVPAQKTSSPAMLPFWYSCMLEWTRRCKKKKKNECMFENTEKIERYVYSLCYTYLCICIYRQVTTSCSSLKEWYLYIYIYICVCALKKRRHRAHFWGNGLNIWKFDHRGAMTGCPMPSKEKPHESLAS